MDKRDLKNLKKRYLIWFYKVTKEALDKIERKFTQADIDRFILSELKKTNKEKAAGALISQFEDYIRKKAQVGLNLKFENKRPRPSYVFLALKIKAIEKAIVKELGKASLDRIKLLYESEMTERILRSAEH